MRRGEVAIEFKAAIINMSKELKEVKEGTMAKWHQRENINKEIETIKRIKWKVWS